MAGINKSNKTFLTVLLHVSTWLIFLSLPAIFNPRRHDLQPITFINDILIPFRRANAVLLIAVFYFNYYIAIPRFYICRRYILFVLSLLTCFGVFFLLNYLMRPTHHTFMPNRGGMNALGPSFNLFMFLIVYASSFALCVYEQWQKAKQEMLQAEVSFLKAQINPHFLFNTLNSIYSLAISKSDKTPDAIVKLSGMMRYSVSEASMDQVPLSREIEYIDNFIELQKLRLSGKIKLSYTVNGTARLNTIAPFLLIPFIENAFKYGVNPEEDSDIRIKLEMGEHDVRLEVYNNKVYLRPDMEQNTGLGINTTRRRLQLLYPGRHELVVQDGEKNFTISLYIRFQ